MLECDPDDVVLCEVGSDGGKALSDLVRFIGLGAERNTKVSQGENAERPTEGCSTR